jgi:hypothetical protein
MKQAMFIWNLVLFIYNVHTQHWTIASMVLGTMLLQIWTEVSK